MSELTDYFVSFDVHQKKVNTFKIVKPVDQVKKVTNCDLSLEYADTDGRKMYLVVVRMAKKVLLQGTVN